MHYGEYCTPGGVFLLRAENKETGKVRELEVKNKIVDTGLQWQVGKLLGDEKYSTVLGEIGLGTSYTSIQNTDLGLLKELSTTSGSYKYSRKRMAVSAGSNGKQIFGDAYWDESEINDVQIFEIGCWTVVGEGTASTAQKIFYARTIIPEGFIKTKNSPESLTITRIDTFTSR